ncbi:autotransporter outer membrane beta-barrel domain-containing protein, partial [Sphingomonas quercus]
MNASLTTLAICSSAAFAQPAAGTDEAGTLLPADDLLVHPLAAPGPVPATETIDGATIIVRGDQSGDQPSPWQVTGPLYIGSAGTAGLNVLDGGVVATTTGNIVIASGSGSQGNVIVSGAGSSLTSAADIIVGISGIGRMDVLDGATAATAGSGQIGISAGPSVATVDGAGSTWTMNDQLSVGANNGGIGVLNITGGGAVTPGSTLFVSDPAGATGTINIDGPGSTLTVDSALSVMAMNGTATLNISNGGAFISNTPDSGFGYAGVYAAYSTGSNAAITVSGAGSRLTAVGSLSIGFQGDATLNITGGGVVSGNYVYLANKANTFTQATIDGEGSALVATGAVYIGSIGQGILTLRNGGLLTSPELTWVGAAAGGTGTVIIGASEGRAPVAPGVLDTPELRLNPTTALILNHNATDYVFDARITNTTAISGDVRHLAGVTTFTANNSFDGKTDVRGGTLFINGDQTAAIGETLVATGAELGGAGTIGGNVTLAAGAILEPGPGYDRVGTLTINGNLALEPEAVLKYQFGEPGVAGGPWNDLTIVKGDIALGGTLNVTVPDGGNFAPGVYRIISYDGALGGDGLMLGAAPAGDLSVETTIPNQVNLVNTARPAEPERPLLLNFWDGEDDRGVDNGVIDGGDGIWRVESRDNDWTNRRGAENGPYANGSFAIFAGAPGRVTVDNGYDAPVASDGMQFLTGGYVIGGDPVTLDPGRNFFRVGDGTSNAVDIVATIEADLVGPGGLDKYDAGTLILTGANSYGGGTVITAGTLQLGDGATSGSIVGDIVDNATLAFDPAGSAAFEGAISGTGGVRKIGPGTTILSGANSYSGPTLIEGGTLRAGATGVFSARSGVSVGADATLDLGGFGQILPGLANAGMVRMGTAPGTVLRVAGDYVGMDGAIAFNTMLEADASPTDRLVVSGGAVSGHSVVLINHVGGNGQLTTGDGIALVLAENGATTASDAFTLGGRVIAGPYEYALYRGGAGGAENWYLRSVLDCALDPLVDICDGQGAPQPPLAVTPEYRAEASLYAAMPAMQLLYDRTLIDTLQERIGDESGGAARRGGGWGPSRIWGRLLVQGGTQGDLARGIYRDGARFNYDMYAVQMGTDLYRGPRDHVGVYGAWGRMRANVRHFDATHAGRDTLKSWTAGGYWTRFWDDGWYSDIVAQYGWSDFRAVSAGPLTMDTVLRRLGIGLARTAPETTGGVTTRG